VWLFTAVLAAASQVVAGKSGPRVAGGAAGGQQAHSRDPGLNVAPCQCRQIMLPALADEKKRVVEDVNKDRQYAIDAAIVRTMKSRKVMNHQQVGQQAAGRHVLCIRCRARPLTVKLVRIFLHLQGCCFHCAACTVRMYV
jgi:hypothetical protein